MNHVVWLLLALALLTLVLRVVAHTLRVAVVDRSCRCRPKLPTHWREPLCGRQEIAFDTVDGIVLRGTILGRQTTAGRGTLVFSHEPGGDRRDASPHAEQLRAEGFDLVMFDYRNRPADAPALSPSMPIDRNDVNDLTAAVRAATKAGNIHGPVGVVGVGKGAVVALCAAAEETEIAALVLQDIPHRATDEAEKLSQEKSVWRRLAGPFRQKRSDCAIDPHAAAAAVRVPVLVIHGHQDRPAPLQAARNLALRIAGPCQLWVVPDAGHGETAQHELPEYGRRCANFFAQAMQPKPSPTQAPPQKTPDADAPHRAVSQAAAH